MSRLKLLVVIAASVSSAALPLGVYAQEASVPATLPAGAALDSPAAGGPTSNEPTAGAPTTAPAEADVVAVPVDQTSPRGALKVLTKAMDDGDVATAQRVMISDGENETSWATAMLRLSSASVMTRRASIEAFGDEGAKAIIGDAAAATAFALAAIDRSTEELQGDHALVRSSDGVEAPIDLRKVDGEWRVPVKVFVGDAPPDKLAETAEKMTRQAEAIESFCTDMTAGKYKSAEDAAQALQLAQVKAVFGEPAAPESPTTAPAGPRSPG